jgi:hypothetical protein
MEESHKVIIDDTDAVMYRGTYEQCKDWMRRAIKRSAPHYSADEIMDLYIIVSNTTGRAVSYVL